MNTTYESESGTYVENPTAGELEELLWEIDGITDSYASLTAEDGSYVQAGGGPTVFTVEVREFDKDGSFRHWKAKLPKGSREERRLIIGGESVAVRADQIIDAQTMHRVFGTFLRERRADPGVGWEDITAMFTEAT